MEFYRRARDRTAVVHLSREGGLYKRSDVIQAVVESVGRNKISSVGQLENYLSWEIVFTDTAAKDDFLKGDHKVKGKSVSVCSLRRSARRLRIQRVPMCVPNEFLADLLSRKGIKVINIEYERDKNDGLPSNIRSVVVDTDNWDNIPDVLPWTFDGFRGVALIFLQGRPPRCCRCHERGHKFYDCPHPYCRRCRATGHMETEECAYRRSYAQTLSGVATDQSSDDIEADVEEQENNVEPDRPVDWYEQTVREDQHLVVASNVNDDLAHQHETADSVASIASDGDKIDEGHAEDDIDGDDESGTAVENVGFRQPRSPAKSHSRSKKRTATEPKQLPVPGSDVETTAKRSRNLSEQMSSVELDPTAGRRHSRTRVCSGRPKAPARDTIATSSVHTGPDKTV